jgi:transposase
METQGPSGSSSVAPRWRRPIELKEQERQELRRLADSGSSEHRLVERARIILAGADGKKSHHQIECELSVARSTVRKWLNRYPQRRAEHPEKPVALWLADDERVGAPARFDEFFWIDVLALVTSDPETSGRPISHWTVRELTDEIIERQLVERIHFTTVSRFLASCQLRPDRVQEWMNRKPQPDFDVKAAQIKDELVQATSDDRAAQEVTVSFDEKTGMQAKERIFPDQPLSPGRPTRQEFEYTRHGTLVLLATMVVHSGEILPAIRDRRTNEVTAQVLVELFTGLMEQGYERIKIILDQLNTHWSQVLVQSVARLCGLPIPEDSEIQTGRQRRSWLTRPDKPIVFVFTPKHASWLNPIEIWFGVLSKKVLRRGSFRSTTDLEQRVLRFIDYYNQQFAHAYTFKRWRMAA